MVHILHDLMLVTLPTIVAYFTGREILRAELRLRKQRKQFREIRMKLHKQLNEKSPVSRTCLQDRYRALGGRLAIEVTSGQFRAIGYGALNSWAEQKTWPDAAVATTGCELTDEIFAAADLAGIVPQEFFDELDSKDITARCRDLSDAPSDTRTVFQSAYSHRESQTP